MTNSMAYAKDSITTRIQTIIDLEAQLGLHDTGARYYVKPDYSMSELLELSLPDVERDVDAAVKLCGELDVGGDACALTRVYSCATKTIAALISLREELEEVARCRMQCIRKAGPDQLTQAQVIAYGAAVKAYGWAPDIIGRRPARDFVKTRIDFNKLIAEAAERYRSERIDNDNGGTQHG